MIAGPDSNRLDSKAARLRRAFLFRPHDGKRRGPLPVWMRGALLLLALAGLWGCARVHVTIETTVGADGAVSRKVDFLWAKGPSLAEAYTLPSGPGWTVKEEQVSQEGLMAEERAAVVPRRVELATLLAKPKSKSAPEPTNDYVRYSARRAYSPGQAVEPDYVKLHPSVAGRAASNAVRVESLPGLLGTTVRYRETFTEASDPEALAAFLKEASRTELKRQIEVVRKASPQAAPWDAFEARELRKLETILKEVLSAWRSIKDEADRKAAEKAFERYSEWLEAVPERLSAAGGLKVEEVEALLEDPEQEQREAKLSDRLDRYVGAHIGEGDFSFTLIVHMPGALIRTNAEEVRGRSTAVCRFADEYFLMRPYICEAESWVPTGF